MRRAPVRQTDGKSSNDNLVSIRTARSSTERFAWEG